MSLFSNLFKGANATSSSLFSDANEYHVHLQQHDSTATPSKRRTKCGKDSSSLNLPDNARKASTIHASAANSACNRNAVADSTAVQCASANTLTVHKRGRRQLHVLKADAELDTHVVRNVGLLSDDKESQDQLISGKTDIAEIDDAAATERTIFVGNVPANSKKSALKALFSKYGSIETVRLRSLPIDNESRMPRTLQIKAGKVDASGISANAFIRFSDRKEALAACAANMSVFKDHHLRVDMAAPRSADVAAAHYPSARSVFIGNLAVDIQEDELIRVFSTGDVETQLLNSVEAVRVVRDSKTRLGKGIAYVLFKSKVAALAALQLNGTECKGRQMRINRVDKSHVPGSAQAHVKRSTTRSVRSQRNDKKSDEFLGQKHKKAGVNKKKAKDGATAHPRGDVKSTMGNSARIVKRPAVAARKAKALLAAGKVPTPSALAALKKKQKQNKHAQSLKPKLS